MIYNGPVLVDEGNEPVHMIGDFPVMRRTVIPDVDRFLSISTTKLGNVRDRGVIQRPKSIFIERFDALFQANFDAVREQVVLTQ